MTIFVISFQNVQPCTFYCRGVVFKIIKSNHKISKLGCIDESFLSNYFYHLYGRASLYHSFCLFFLQQYRSGFFESDAQAKQLGRDIILYAIKKQRGQIIKLVRGGCYLGVNKGKGRGTYVWVTLCTLEKDDFFPLSLPRQHPPLTNFVIFLLCFLTAYKMMSRPSCLA